MDVETIIALGLSVYGALLSTILAIRELTKERRQILVFLQYGEFTTHYSIVITNIGNRPITITSIALAIFSDVHFEGVPSNAMLEVHKQLPVTLTDGQHIEFVLSLGLSEEIYKAKENVRIIVYDSENREYKKFKTISDNEKFGVRGPRKMK